MARYTERTFFVKSLIMVVALVMGSHLVMAQDERTLEYLRQEEQRKKAMVMRELDSGVYFMDHQKYELADEKFRYVLANVKSVPSDLTYYFGKNSFYLLQYKQSVDWINKYIQLKGTGGQHYQDAIQVLQAAEAELVKEKAVQSKKASEVLSKNYDIDCGPSNKVICPVCKGERVVVKRGSFGNEYQTCSYCDQHGMLTCDEYNKLLRGQLTKRQ